MRYIVYKLTFPNNKIYVGQTKQKFKDRMDNHKYDSTRKKLNGKFKQNSLVYNAIRKYGWDNIKKEIILYCEESQVDYYEIELIKLYNSLDENFGYNLESGGNKNKTLSEKTKQKLRELNIGKNHPMFGIHRFGKDAPNYGNKHSEETKQKMRKSALGKIKSDEHRKNISKAKLGKKLSKETRQKMSRARIGEKNPNYGKQSNKKSILCYDKNEMFIKEFEFIKQAENELNIPFQTISRILRNKQKNFTGYIFKYKNDKK